MVKVLGAIFGYMALSIPGAIIGFFIGRFIDRSMNHEANLGGGLFGGASGGGVLGGFGNLDAKRHRYLQTTFTVMGHIAKADGRVSEQEVQLAENLMSKMSLSLDHRKQAIAYFKAGSGADFQLQPELDQFVTECGKRSSLANMLLVMLISVALADEQLHESEHSILRNVAGQLGFNVQQFEQLMGMVAAQQGFSQQGQQHSGGQYHSGGQRSSYQSANELDLAYKALGVSPSIDDKGLKRAYRKLISKHHPDKLIAQGLPDDMIAIATEKSQEIQSAYDLLEKHRKQ